MSGELEMLEKRIRRLESQNSRLKLVGIGLAVVALTTTAWGQTATNAVVQAQKIELRDNKGHVRAELAVLQAGTKDEAPALRFLDADGNVESLLKGDVFTIFKKGADNQATFGKHGLEFGDGKENTFFAVSTDERNQLGRLQLNDYHKKVYASIFPEDLAKLHTAEP